MDESDRLILSAAQYYVVRGDYGSLLQLMEVRIPKVHPAQRAVYRNFMGTALGIFLENEVDNPPELHKRFIDLILAGNVTLTEALISQVIESLVPNATGLKPSADVDGLRHDLQGLVKARGSAFQSPKLGEIVGLRVLSQVSTITEGNTCLKKSIFGADRGGDFWLALRDRFPHWLLI